MVRCIRCGATIEGVAQFCDNCLAEKRAEEDEAARRSAERGEQAGAAITPAAPGARSVFCPNCGATVSPDANFCAFCRTEIRELRAGQRTLEYAGFWMRFVAWFIDSIILNILGLIISLMVNDFLAAIAFQVALGAFYHVGFWVGADGSTPGKMAMGVKVVMANGEPVEVGNALLRYIGYIPSSLLLGIGYLMIAFSSEKRGLHDIIGGTVVVKSR